VVARAVCQQLDVEFAWGRLFFLYGPFESPGRFVPSIVVPLLRGDPAPMTDGTQKRDFLHSEDAGAAFAALAVSGVAGAVNIASGRAISLRDLAQQIARRLDREELLQIGARPMREGEPPTLQADVTRLRDEVGWSPRIELAGGLDSVISWWRGYASYGRARELHGGWPPIGPH
jgi:nucleoside-diphosphate-sugar epimerase